ncbi:hypothetical protein AGMMS49960_07010 [Betaproteobacteria bacterium]|nr:hypothetical protein AGMMS49543_28020 [Betaproteobacteria bacterium]GHU00018.1 hypothetical protein AGMMS49960_07010 [Betaproteobacteria bacterium]GHU22617.1 hypothetical protein AGMMS50243_22550 [Betaproteobacteria bacterium]
MTSITITVDSPPVLAVLQQLLGVTTPAGMAPAMKEIGDSLVESTIRRFETGTGPDGSPWKPLKPGTVLERYRKMLGGMPGLNEKNGPNAGRLATASVGRLIRPLDESGRLLGSIHAEIVHGGAGVEVGTNRSFPRKKKEDGASEQEGDGVSAAVHQFGTRDGHIPARPFLGLSGGDTTLVLDILRELLDDASRI